TLDAFTVGEPCFGVSPMSARFVIQILRGVAPAYWTLTLLVFHGACLAAHSVGPDGTLQQAPSAATGRQATFGIENPDIADHSHTLWCTYGGAVTSCSTVDSLVVPAQGISYTNVSFSPGSPGIGDLTMGEFGSGAN